MSRAPTAAARRRRPSSDPPLDLPSHPEVRLDLVKLPFLEFINQLEEIGFSDLNNEDRIQPEFDAIKAKTLSELEEDMKNYWKTPSKKIPPTERPHFPIASASLNQVYGRKGQGLASRKLLTKRSSRSTLFQTSMISMTRSSTASRKRKTYSASILLLKNPPLNGFSTLQN